MPLVKIVMCDEIACEENSFNFLRESISDWEEISNEELVFLRKHIYDIVGSNSGRPMIIVKDEVPVVERIKNIKIKLKEQEEILNKMKEERELAKQKSLERKLNKSIEKKRELYEKLKKEFEEVDLHEL